MIRIESVSDLKQFGIIYLTGEDCNLSYRGLYDLTEKGREHVCNALKLPYDCKLSENANSGRGGDPHVASISLTRTQAMDIGVFALLGSGCHKVAVVHNGYVGIEAGEDLKNKGEVSKEDKYRYIDNWILTRNGEDHRVNFMGIKRLIEPRFVPQPCSKSFHNYHAMAGGYLG